MTTTAKPTSRHEWQSDQEERWCPGCGDYTILAAVQNFMAELDIERKDVVFVSGIGCSSRFPYYMNTYGFHGIHGRAPAIASGIAVARPDLHVWVVTGDGDGLSIGGNHLIHALRRNINIKILLFNNQIYGLTKGQYSPTSEKGKRTKSSPSGSIDVPFNPVSLALGAEASFVARTIDMDRDHTLGVLRAAHDHRGSAFVEIYQNCNIFNDKAFLQLTGKQERLENRINLEHGAPVTFGENGERGVMIYEGTAHIVTTAEVGLANLHVHDSRAESPAAAFALSRLSHGPFGPTPVGVFRDAPRALYEEDMERQIADARATKGDGDLKQLLSSGGSWVVE